MIDLVSAVPATQALMDRHVATNREIVPQLLMADLRHFLVDAAVSNEPVLLDALLTEIERLASNDDPGIRDLVETGFIRALVRGDRHERGAVEEIRRLAGPATIEALRACEREHHQSRAAIATRSPEPPTNT
jgi:hypothetical protein